MKFQVPSTKLQGNLKLQAPKRAPCELEILNLEFPWNLGLGD
jgi:hypothetical protein